MTGPETALETTEKRRALPPRRPLPAWVQSAILLLVFCAGGIAGAMLATEMIHSRMEYYREHETALPNDIVPRLQFRLQLSDEQTEEVRRIIELRHPRMMRERNESARGMLLEFEAMQREVAAVLDAEQAAAWSEIANSVRRRFLPPALAE